MIADKTLCSGCGACVKRCPMHCIEMKMDEEGFLYPEIDVKKCTNCGLCRKICPANSRIEKNPVKKMYAFVHKDRDVFMKSSSGGAFSALCEGHFECFGKSCIFGAVMCDDLKCRHLFATSFDDIHKFRKSKYIPSDAIESFRECKEKLDSGYNCVFSGTPCIVAGLKAYLGKDYENLITVDLLCRGVPNNIIWEKYITGLQKMLKSNVNTVMFRHKVDRKYGKEIRLSSENLLIKLKDRDHCINRHEDLFLRGYHNGLFYRKSCYGCIYSGEERVSDITISDFWGYEDVYPENGCDGKAGVSAIMINTLKGQEFVEKTDIGKYAKLYHIGDMEELKKRNLPLIEPVKLTRERACFFKYFKRHSFAYSVKRVYAVNDLISYVKRKLWFLKRLIKNDKKRM